MRPWITLCRIGSAAVRIRNYSASRRLPKSPPICVSQTMCWRPRLRPLWLCHHVKRRSMNPTTTTSTKRTLSIGLTRTAAGLLRRTWACPPTKPVPRRWTTTRRTSCPTRRTHSLCRHRLCLCQRHCRCRCLRRPPRTTST